jgi:hypothetical protein
VNGGKILRNHGEKADGREIVTLDEFGHFTGGGSASGGSSGVSSKTVKKIADEAALKAVKAEEEKRLAQEVKQAEADSGRDEVINTHGDAIAANATAIETETADRKAADDEIREKAAEAKRAAEAIRSHGPLVEGYVVLGSVVGSPVMDDQDVARNPFGGGAGAGVNVGADIESGRVNIFADGIVGADGGAGPVFNGAAGFEIVGEKGWGGFTAYSVRSSQPNSLETEVLGRAALLGVSYTRTFAESGAKHGLIQLRAGAGLESIGMAGDSAVTDAVGIAGRLTVSVGGGVGALQ